jgi:hypothetical protein
MPPSTHLTIADVLAQFLTGQRKRLAPKTFARYEHVIELLQHCLDGYAHQSLNKADVKLFDRLFNDEGDEHREFCQIFGPEHILPNVGEFLDYFMIRKAIAGKDLLRTAGTVTKKLATWLAEKGYAEVAEVEDAKSRAAAASRDLPQAKELASRLRRFAGDQKRGSEDDEIEDYFMLTRVEPGKIWLEAMNGRELGPIQVPEDIGCRYTVGWTISGVVGRVGKRWRLVEAWNVYPG